MAFPDPAAVTGYAAQYVAVPEPTQPYRAPVNSYAISNRDVRSGQTVSNAARGYSKDVKVGRHR